MGYPDRPITVHLFRPGSQTAFCHRTFRAGVAIIFRAFPASLEEAIRTVADDGQRAGEHVCGHCGRNIYRAFEEA